MVKIARIFNYFKFEISEFIIITLIFVFILRYEPIVTNLVFFATVIPLVMTSFIRKISFFTGIRLRDKVIGRGRTFLVNELRNLRKELNRLHSEIDSLTKRITNREPINKIVKIKTDAWPILTYALKYDFIGDIEPHLYIKLIKIFDAVNTLSQQIYVIDNLLMRKGVNDHELILRSLYELKREVDNIVNDIELLLSKI